MKFCMNLTWFLFIGLWLWLALMLTGVVLCATVIGIPFGIACFGFAGRVVWPW